MTPRRMALVSMVAVMALVAAGCAGDDDTGTAAPDAPTPTHDTVDETPTPPPPTPEPTAPEPTSVPTVAATETVTVYFTTGDGTDCGQVSPFDRPVERGSLGAAITELLVGPTAEETAAGASSFFSDKTAVALTLLDATAPGLLVVGFDDLRSTMPNASTSCGSTALLSQLNTTILQYVPRVRYEMLSSCQLFSEWLQLECMDYTSEGADPAQLTLAERAAGSGCEDSVYGRPDGIWFGYLVSATASSVDFDLACWFVGDAAVDASADDGEESPPPNDFYIRNAAETIETIDVEAVTMVSWLADVGDPASEATIPFDEWLAMRDARPVQPGLWLTVQDGQVVEMAEQYVP